MSARKSLWLPMIVVFSCATAAFGTLPANRTQSYDILSDPSDPSSKKVWTITLRLAPQSRDADKVAWKVEQVVVERFAPGGSLLTTWTKFEPTVNASGGVWTIEHADGDHPQLSEFCRPPAISGTATTGNPLDKGLVVAFAGKPNNLPPQSSWSGLDVAILDYNLTLEGGTQPEDEGEDEPSLPRGGNPQPSGG